MNSSYTPFLNFGIGDCKSKSLNETKFINIPFALLRTLLPRECELHNFLKTCPKKSKAVILGQQLRYLPPTRPLKLLDIGCDEGKDAVFFARCGYIVSAFDLSETGLEKTRLLAEKANVTVNTFRANLLHFRLTENYNILYSSGVFQYIKPEIRAEIMENYKTHVNDGGLVAFHTFVEKPFIERVPDRQRDSYAWKSGELFTYFHDLYIENCCEYIFDCNSSGVPHKHAANRLFARNFADHQSTQALGFLWFTPL